MKKKTGGWKKKTMVEMKIEIEKKALIKQLTLD